MNIDIDKIDILLEQADRWLTDGATETSVPIRMKWTGGPDSFDIEYDRDRAGLLIIAIASDPLLAAAASAALVKVLSEYGDLRRRAVIQAFEAALESVHARMAEEGLCDTEYPIMFARNGRRS